MELYFNFWWPNHKIWLQTSKLIFEKTFKYVDYIDRKIIVFEVKKGAFFILCKIGSLKFESSWLTTLVLYKVETFDIMLRDWIQNP